jgi:uncharacterized membrane protein
MTSRASSFSPFADRAAAALAAGALFFVSWGLVHTWFWAHGQLVDWPTYLNYGRAMRDGLVPYRDFAVEYPPAALPVFVLPTWLHGDYAAAFAWLMALCGVLLVAVVASVRPVAAFYVALAPLLVGSLILSRFDLWPTLLATASLAALLRGRHAWGWALLGLAVAAKAWPLVLVPLALVWSIRRGRTLAPLAGAAVLAAATLPFAVVAPGGLWDSISGQASRPLQVESLGAAFLTTFTHPRIVTSHGSQNIVGHHALALTFGALQLLALASLWIAFARGPATGGRLLRYAAACTCAFIVLGKVLSPQYLIWLVPLVPLVRGRRGVAATALLTAALVLTQVWFPQRYFAYALGFRNAGVVLARDLVLVVLLAVLAWPVRLAPRV